MTQPLLLAVPDGDIAPVTEDAAINALSEEQIQIRKDKAAERMRADIAELMFCLEARKRGYRIKLIGSGCQGYDVILERDGMRPIFVQVKHAFIRAQGNYCINNSKNGKLYSPTAYDVLAFYMWDRRQWIFYTRSELGNRTTTSWTPPELITRTSPSSAPSARNSDNWELIDQVAAVYSQESVGLGQPMSDPQLYKCPCNQ